MLSLSGTILLIQLLFWFCYTSDSHWHWPQTMSPIGFGSASALLVPAVLLIATRCSKSRKLLFGTAIFGCVSMLYCLSVGVSNVIDYSLVEDKQNSSVLTMGLVNLGAGTFVCAYLFIGLGHFYCCQRCGGTEQNAGRNDSSDKCTKISPGFNPALRLYDWGIPRQMEHMTAVGQSSQKCHYPVAPFAPPPYQP